MIKTIMQFLSIILLFALLFLAAFLRGGTYHEIKYAFLALLFLCYLLHIFIFPLLRSGKWKNSARMLKQIWFISFLFSDVILGIALFIFNLLFFPIRNLMLLCRYISIAAYVIGFPSCIAYILCVIIEELSGFRDTWFGKAVVRYWKMISIIFVSLIICAAAIFYYSASSANRMKKLTFVKEWEVEDLKSDTPQQVVSLTANRYGIFALMQVKEYEPILPDKNKKANAMTAEDKEKFLDSYGFFSGGAILEMPATIKDEYIDFFLDHFVPPRKASQIPEEEKKYIIDFLDQLKEKYEYDTNIHIWKDNLQEGGIDYVIDLSMKNLYLDHRTENFHYEIVRYDYHGNLLNHFAASPKPFKIGSDSDGNLYSIDFKSNLITKYNAIGRIISAWIIDADPNKAQFLDSSKDKGFFVTSQKVYVANKLNDKNSLLYEFDLKGTLIRKGSVEPPLSRMYLKLWEGSRGETPLFKIPLWNKKSPITDIVADDDGTVFLFSAAGFNTDYDSTMVILNDAWKKKRAFRTVLQTGFDKPEPVYDARRKIWENTQNKIREALGFTIHQFTSEPDTSHPYFYFASAVALSPESIYITFCGRKPAGVVDAMIVNRRGKLIGYLKQARKSYSPWFSQLNDYQRYLTTDDALYITFYENNVVIARTMSESFRWELHKKEQQFTFIQRYIVVRERP